MPVKKEPKPGLKLIGTKTTTKTIKGDVLLPVKKGRGGARPGAGRKNTKGEFQQIHTDMPLIILEAMDASNIKNKTAFLIFLCAKELSTYQNVRRNAKLRAALDKIKKDPNLNF